MIDLNMLRAYPVEIKGKIAKKDPSYKTDTLIALDELTRSLKTSIEAKQAAKNKLSDQARGNITEEVKEQSRQLSIQIKNEEEELLSVEEQFRDLYLRCPNLPMDDLPIGNKESNLIVRQWGSKPTFSFAIQNHHDIGTKLDWLDFEAAARTSGSQFALYKNTGVQLHFALAMFLFNNAQKHGYKAVLPPFLINEKTLEGASNFPRFREEVYAIEKDQLYLTPTAEVNLTSLYRDKILNKQDFPIRHAALTSCFRREAGGYGSTERGLIRIHQFDKVEIYSITAPEDSNAELERMVACGEDALKQLGLHYQISKLATGDCSFASAKTYDIEVWMPGQNEYKEVSSASNCTDFQARRSGIRYREQANEKPRLVHTLNASSLALPRLYVALLETYQQADGSVHIPDVLKSVTIHID